MAKKAKKKTKRTPSQAPRKILVFLKSDDFAKIRAIFYLLMAAFLFVAVISFFFTGQMEDRLDWHNNWLGWLGGCLSVLVVKHTFGLASIGFSLLLVSIALTLLRRTRKNARYDKGLSPEKPHKVVLPWWSTFGYTLFWMAWVSCTLGYVNHLVHPNGEYSLLENYAGAFGVLVAEGLCSVIRIFTPVLLLALAGVMVFLVHKVKLPEIHLPERKATIDDEIEEVDEPETKAQAKSVPAPEPLMTTPPEPETPEKEDDKTDFEPDGPVVFDIDDEFSRINQKAQAHDKPLSEPTFTVNNTEVTADPEEEPSTEEPKEHDIVVEDGQLIDRSTGQPLPPYDPKLDLKDFQMPTVDMLIDWERNNTKVTQQELIDNNKRIVDTLRNYGIEIEGIVATPGPTVTLYEIKPAPGVRISKIKSLEDDIALSLAALGIRIIAPIPGKGSVGIEVPNANPQVVSMKTMLSSDAFMNNTKYELPVAMGKTISNEPFVTDLAKMPHLLMAGATGTGKSVGLNAVIASLLYKKHPAELKFVMVDPKKVELSLYSKIERHYLAKLPDSEEAIITDVKKVVRTLNSLCIEMDNRYDLLKMAQVRKIKEYNEKFCHRQLNPEHGHRYLPYIVLVIDEFADLIMTAGKEVEMPICRLAQLARAVGIHLIIATQRPTTNIITGTIKANFPARIAFRVTSAIDSRTILDTGGANQLVGRGDMLISLAGSDMVRVQCALIETEEIDKLADFIGQQRGYADGEGFLLPEYLDENEEPNKDFDPRQKDDMFNEAARLVVASQFGSTSLLQRKLQLGYNRAGRIVDQLEAAGIVGPYNGSKAREVLIKDEVQLEEILRSL